MLKDLLREGHLQADETTVPVQMHDRGGSDHEAYLWQYGKPGGETVFDFCLHRGREGPERFLEKWEAFCRPTAIRPTKVWADRRSCTWDVGRIIWSPR